MNRKSGEIELTSARWGFVPHWWKQPKPPGAAFNARSEEAAGKPMWRDAYRDWRCLIPAVGWYEWQAAQRPDPATGEIKPYKQPHFIYQEDGRLVCFGGLLSWWRTKGQEGTLTCAIVTREAAPSVADVHDRMPAVVQEVEYGKWLDVNVIHPEEIAVMIDEGQMNFKHHPVTTRLNGAKNDDAKFVDRAVTA